MMQSRMLRRPKKFKWWFNRLRLIHRDSNRWEHHSEPNHSLHTQSRTPFLKIAKVRCLFWSSNKQMDGYSFLCIRCPYWISHCPNSRAKDNRNFIGEAPFKMVSRTFYYLNSWMPIVFWIQTAWASWTFQTYSIEDPFIRETPECCFLWVVQA